MINIAKSFGKKIFNMSISWRFTIIYFLIIMVPTCIIWASYYSVSVDSINKQSDSICNETISKFKQNIQYTLTSTESLADEMVVNADLQTYLSENFTFNDKELYYFIYRLQDEITQIKRIYPNQYLTIRLFFKNDKFEEEYDILYNFDRIKNDESFEEYDNSNTSIWGAIKKREEYYDLYKGFGSIQNNDYVVPLYRCIYNIKSGELIGVMEFDILVNKFFGNKTDLSLVNNGFIFITDMDNKVVISGNDIIKENTTIDLNNNSEPFLINKIAYRKVYQTVSIGDKEFKIIALTPEEDLIKNGAVQVGVPIVLFIVSIPILFILVFFITRLLFNRLKVLIKMMKRVEAGEFNVKIDESSHDEIGELAHSFNRMAGKLENMVYDLIEKETAQRDAEIRALQSQINPHFFFNTLESLRMNCEIRGQIDLADALSSLGSIFRYNIKWNNAYVSLRQEIEHVENYIKVMKIRFGNKIDFRVIISEEVLNLKVIKMILQPVVENCFAHAFKDKEGSWGIQIKTSILNGDLYIEIIDNGNGIEKDRLDEINRQLNKNKSGDLIFSNNRSSIGMWNVNNRIKIQFGSSYGLTVESEINIGTKVTIVLPVLAL